MRVTYEPLLTDDLWDYHWKMAALQIKDTVEKKGRKTYALPSILVLDVSRLGYAGQMLTEPGIAKFQEQLDSCEFGNLGGVLVVRATELGDPGRPVLAGLQLARAGAGRRRRAAQQPDAEGGLNQDQPPWQEGRRAVGEWRPQTRKKMTASPLDALLQGKERYPIASVSRWPV